MMATWLQRRSTISRTCEVRKIVAPREIMLLQHRFQRVGCDGIDAFERLIEKQNARTVNHGGGQREFFLHAVRIIGDQRLRLIDQLHEFEQLGGPLGGGGGIESVHASNEIQIFRAGQPAEKRHAFGHDADLAFHFDGIRSHIRFEDPNAAGRGREKPREHFDSGGFAGAVGTEETEKLSRRHVKIHVFDGDEIAEAAR